MWTPSDIESGDSARDALHRLPRETLPQTMRQRRVLWACFLGWTAFVSVALAWLWVGEDGLWVWGFPGRDLNPAGFNEKLQAIFRGELGLQRAHPWILLSPYLALITWHFPLERNRLRRNAPLHVFACLVFVWLCHTIHQRTSITRARFAMRPSLDSPAPGAPPSEIVPLGSLHEKDLEGEFAATAESFHSIDPTPPESERPPRPPGPPKVSLRSTMVDLLAYGAVTGVIHSLLFHRRMRDRERRGLLLESKLAHARLHALQAQLHPHFLFNSLNAIVALLRRDPRLAETKLIVLSELLRLALCRSEKQVAALREEWEFVHRYLDLQQTRFGDKLRVEHDIAPDTLDCLVPTLVLQPLVENAIRHGIEPSENGGTLRIHASRHGEELALTVEDDGVGLLNPTQNAMHFGGIDPDAPAQAPGPATHRPPSQTGTGIGLANLRERLQALYGSHQTLELTPRATGGVTVRVEIPWRPQTSCQQTHSFQP